MFTRGHGGLLLAASAFIIRFSTPENPGCRRVHLSETSPCTLPTASTVTAVRWTEGTARTNCHASVPCHLLGDTVTGVRWSSAGRLQSIRCLGVCQQLWSAQVQAYKCLVKHSSQLCVSVTQVPSSSRISSTPPCPPTLGHDEEGGVGGTVVMCRPCPPLSPCTQRVSDWQNLPGVFFF